MSTNWDVRCKAHRAVSDDVGGGGDFGRNVLLNFWRDREAMVAVHQINPDWLGEIANGSMHYGPFMFIFQHHDCAVIFQSEYGDTYDPATDTEVRLRPNHEIVSNLKALVHRAGQVTPSDRGIVYLGDLKAILYGTPPPATKVGTNDGTGD